MRANDTVFFSAGMQTKASDSSGARMVRRSKSTRAVHCLVIFSSFTRTVSDTWLMPSHSAFFHKKSFGGLGEPYTGQAVSFVFEEGPKGAAATEVKEEEGGIAAPAEDEGIREMGTVKVRITWLVPNKSCKAKLLVEFIC